MVFSPIKRLHTIMQADPLAWRFFQGILTFIWGTFFLSLVVSRIFDKSSILLLLVISAVLSVLSLIGYLLFLYKSVFLYYSILLPLYKLSISSRNVIFKWLVGLFLGKHRDHWLDLILRSQEWNQNTRLKSEGLHGGDLFEPDRVESAPPLVIRREHIDSHRWSREKAFAIVLLFNQLQLKRVGPKVILQADLRNQSCAIYNNRGKEFILDEFLPKDTRSIDYYARLSQDTHEFLRNHTNKHELDVQIKALRWVSGGFLPVAKWHGKKWVCLFFRDIYPVGWNIANGASENKDEYKHLNKLIYRETLEELVICSGNPDKLTNLKHRLFNLPPLENIYVPELVRKHKELREEHDGILLEFEEGPDLQDKPSSHEIQVTFHENWESNIPKVTKNILIAVNPLELGVEVVKVGEFELAEQDRLMDGEICKSATGDYLVRQPVIMLSVDYLKERYKRSNSSLGRTADQDLNDTSRTLDDSKILDKIPSWAFHIFTDDILLRQKRLNYLEKNGLTELTETKRLREWDKNARPMFDAFIGGYSKSDLTGVLTTFLPTAWKTIELAIEQDAL